MIVLRVGSSTKESWMPEQRLGFHLPVYLVDGANLTT